eukprot:jgi/Ulvmu1/6180/UM028_0036.1
MEPATGCWLAAVSASAVLVASASVLRRRRASHVANADPEPEEETLVPRATRRCSLTPWFAAFAVAALAGATYFTFHYLGSRQGQCAVRGPVNRNVILDRFKNQSRNFNSTPKVTDDETVQAWFDAGMFYAYGFDHREAIAIFDRASAAGAGAGRSMCTWGKAYAMGPFVNRVMRGEAAPTYPAFTCNDQQAAHKVAVQASQQAAESSAGALITELTTAMAQRYSPAPACNTTTLRADELQYARELSRIARKHQDATAAALAAEAYMNAHPWKYTLNEKSAVLRKDTQAALDLLKYSLSLEQRHVLALHLTIHLLETQPRESSPGEDATLAEGEAAADALAALAHFPELTGHLVHMPCHVFIRKGRWADAIEASRAAAERDQRDSDNCQVAYAPEHNLDMALFAAMMAGDYNSSMWSARQLARAPQAHMPGYISAGINHVAAVHVGLYFGRCSEMDVRLGRASRGRSGTKYQAYTATVAALKSALCMIQTFHEQQRSAASGRLSAAQAAEMAALVKKVDTAASMVEEDVPTKPGYGLGLYSAAYHALTKMYALIAKAAHASAEERWDEAVMHMARAAKVENGMGYIEPPRMDMITQPCLVSVMVLSGDYVAAMKVSNETLARFPATLWGNRTVEAIDLASSDEHTSGMDNVRRAAHAACPLIFGSAHL